MQKLLPIDLRIVLAAGPTASGKTMLGLTTGAPMERVLVYDTEGSACTYRSVWPFHLVDITESLPVTFTMEDYWAAWVKHVSTLRRGVYDVIVVDTVDLLDDAVTAWVKANPGRFGYSEGQFRRYSMFMWRCVHNTWRNAILRLSSVCQLLILTAHTKNVYLENNGEIKAVGKTRRGKEVLTELASLEVLLSRGNPYPSAEVVKSRVFIPTPEPRNLFPVHSQIAPFTWDNLRRLMAEALAQKV